MSDALDDAIEVLTSAGLNVRQEIDVCIQNNQTGGNIAELTPLWKRLDSYNDAIKVLESVVFLNKVAAKERDKRLLTNDRAESVRFVVDDDKLFDDDVVTAVHQMDGWVIAIMLPETKPFAMSYDFWSSLPDA